MVRLSPEDAADRRASLVWPTLLAVPPEPRCQPRGLPVQRLGPSNANVRLIRLQLFSATPEYHRSGQSLTPMNSVPPRGPRGQHRPFISAPGCRSRETPDTPGARVTALAIKRAFCAQCTQAGPRLRPAEAIAPAGNREDCSSQPSDRSSCRPPRRSTLRDRLSGSLRALSGNCVK